MTLCKVRELGTSVNISKQSMMALTLGNFCAIDFGMWLLTISLVGQIDTEASLKYMKLIHVINIVLTVLSFPSNNHDRCEIEKLYLIRQRVKTYDVKGLRAHFLPRISLVFFGREFVVGWHISTFSPQGPGSKYLYMLLSCSTDGKPL